MSNRLANKLLDVSNIDDNGQLEIINLKYTEVLVK